MFFKDHLVLKWRFYCSLCVVSYRPLPLVSLSHSLSR